MGKIVLSSMDMRTDQARCCFLFNQVMKPSCRRLHNIVALKAFHAACELLQ